MSSNSGAPRHMAAAYQQPKKRKGVLTAFLTILLLAGLGTGGWFAYNRLLAFDVTVNGQTVTAHLGDNVQTLIDKGYAAPVPGNLIAVDDTLIASGEGNACTATINDAPATQNSALTRNATVQIDDGTDTYEEEVVTEEPIPFAQEEGNRDFDSYYGGSIHVLSDGTDGVRTTRIGSVSGKTVSQVTKQPINAGYQTYTAKPDQNVIALTFDDGPHAEYTAQILDVLEEYGAKATFFTIGEQIANNADVVRRAHDMGCQICTHTWDHARGSGNGVDLTHMSPEEQVDEVRRGYAAIAEALGEEPEHILRAPGGNFYGDLINTVWDDVDYEIGWNIDTQDWNRPGTEAIVESILSVEPGQVILMHDGGGDRSQTVEALRIALPQLIERGYSFVTVSELISYGMPIPDPAPANDATEEPTDSEPDNAEEPAAAETEDPVAEDVPAEEATEEQPV